MAQPHPNPAASTRAAQFSWFDAGLILLAAVVVLAAGWLSFDTLQNLGLRVGWGEDKAWLLPLSIDVQAAAGTLGWVHPTIAPATRATARRMTLTAVVLSTVGNAVEHLITAATSATPWWDRLLAVVVGALPVLAMALTIHLVSQLLVNRSTAKADVADAERQAAEEQSRAEDRRRVRPARPRPAAPARPAPPAERPATPAAIPAATGAANPPTEPAIPATATTATTATTAATADGGAGEKIDPAVAASGLTVGERLDRLIDHELGRGKTLGDLSGKQLADKLVSDYSIPCSEQRGRQVLSVRRKAAAQAASAATGPDPVDTAEEVNSSR